jgi:hypothetical protein
MKFLHTPNKIAGLLSLLSAAIVLAVWYPLLFVEIPSNTPVTEFAVRAFAFYISAENSSRPMFVWLAFAPLMSIALAFSYFSILSRSRVSASIVFSLSAALGVSAFFFVGQSIAFFFALPCYWGVLCIRKSA